MQKILLVLLATVSLSLIVMSPAVQVNHSSKLPEWNGGVQTADGIPMPPPQPPPKKTLGVNRLMADGIPMPPPQPPPKKTVGVNGLVADGIPMPPPQPPKKTISVG